MSDQSHDAPDEQAGTEDVPGEATGTAVADAGLGLGTPLGSGANVGVAGATVDEPDAPEGDDAGTRLA